MFSRPLVAAVATLALLTGCPDGKDHGNWTDQGTLSGCKVDANAANAVCGELQTYDLSGCDRNFANFATDGSYVIHRRYETPEPGQFSPSSLHLDSASPSTEYIDGNRGLTWRQLGAGEFFVGRRVQGTVNGVATTFTRSYAGCKAIDAERITGCFATCRILGDGTRTVQTGSFEALNVRRPAGEAEAAGMSLLANAKVEVLGQPGTPFGLPADVYVTKNRAYVVSLDWSYVGEGGLTVFDVSNPAAPVITAQVPSNGGYWNGVWAKGDALYVASGESGVVTFDISNPDAPTLESATQVSEAGLNVHTVFVRDDVLYAMAPRPVVGGEVIFYDVKDPLAPKLLGRHTIADAAGVTGAYPHDAFVYEGKMYVNYWSAGYQVLDVSDPKNPVSLGAYTYPNATSHANAVGRYGARTIAFEGGEDWSAHLRVLDVTDPAKIQKIGEYARRTGPSIHNMVLSEDKQRLYVAHYQEGVRVLDVSKPESPTELAHFNTYAPNDPYRGMSFYDGAIGIRVPGDGRIYAIDTSRGLFIFPEP